MSTDRFSEERQKELQAQDRVEEIEDRLRSRQFRRQIEEEMVKREGKNWRERLGVSGTVAGHALMEALKYLQRQKPAMGKMFYGRNPNNE